MVGQLKWMMPLTLSRTGAVKTSPSGMLTLPSQGMAGMSLMLKVRSVSAGAFETDLVGAVHQVLERLHGAAHFCVVEGADVEVEILERFGAHLGHLRHGRAWPAEDDPAGFLDADFLVDGFPEMLFVEFLLVGRDVGEFGNVGVAARADVALHVFHLEALDAGGEFPLLGCAGEHEGAVDFVAFKEDERAAAGGGGAADEGFGESVGDVDGFDEDVFAGFYFTGIADEDVGEFFDAGVGHGFSGEVVEWDYGRGGTECHWLEAVCGLPSSGATSVLAAMVR